MGTQEFLGDIIEKTCSNKVEIGSKVFKFYNEAIQHGFEKYYEKFPDAVMRDEFILQVLCHVLRERALMNKDMNTIMAECDAFKTKVEELKIANAKLEATIEGTPNAEDDEDPSPRQRTLKWKSKDECRTADPHEFVAVEEQKTLYRRLQIMLHSRGVELETLEKLAKMQQPDSKIKLKIEKKNACIANIKKQSSSLYGEVVRRMDALIAKANNSPKPQAHRLLKRSQAAILEVERAKKKLCIIDTHLNKASDALTAAIPCDQA